MRLCVNLLMTKYQYTISDHSEGGYVIMLTQLASGRTKTYRSAGGVKEFLIKHMDSLTDVCCDDLMGKQK